MSSPRLLVVDLDGTLCDQTDGGDAYWTAAPHLDVIGAVNNLHGRGWYVTIHTARGMRTCMGDVQLVERLYRKRTEEWLERNGVCYDRLLFGKPAGDLYVDDRGMGPGSFVFADIDEL